MEQLSIVFFFFSSRRRHTRLQGDWSSDVCSSDLPCNLRGRLGNYGQGATDKIAPDVGGEIAADNPVGRGVVVISHPYSDNNFRRKSDEPGIAIFLGGAGLSSNRNVWKTRRLSGSLIDDA